jgi:hypothetical protein
MLLVLAPALLGADCGAGIACPPAAPPMTSARAKEIDPGVETGIAVSTTHVFGDCRPGDPEAPSACGDTDLCARRREALRVFVVPVNVSMPVAERCDPALSVEDAAEVAVFAGSASDQGELVISLEPGRYTLLVSADDRCAVCGLLEEGGACTADVERGKITVRDLVLDRSTH